MKRFYLGAACALAVAAVSSPALAGSADGSGGYNRLALDQYIGQSLAEQNAQSTAVPSAIDMMQGQSPTIMAAQTARFDAEGYLIGPNGKRVQQPVRQRWRIGVFR